MSATEDNGWTIFAPPIRGRSCGACRACCTQVPVVLDDGHKAANERCKHLCSRGCSIYPTRPMACRYWSCRWLFDPLATGLRRPDLSGCVVDPQLDTILANGKAMPIVQVWCDPKRPDAHHEPHLRAYLAAVAARYRTAAIVRHGSSGGFVLVAPCLHDGDDWLEIPVEAQTAEDMRRRLADIVPPEKLLTAAG